MSRAMTTATDDRLDTSYRVLHITDTHLSRSRPEGVTAWNNLVKYTEWTRPDLVIHTGDVIFDDPDDEDDHQFSALQLRRLSSPWRVVPGNHDIGDSAPDPYQGLVTPERLARWRQHFGADRWLVELGNWVLIGLNSQLFDNVLTEEDELQWNWFEDAANRFDAKKIAVFFHKPPCIYSLSDALLVNKAIGLGARRRLREAAERGRIKLMGCGHLHEFMTMQSHGALIVAAPSLSMAPPSGGATRGLGLRANGAVEYQFSESGFRFRMLEAEELQAPVLSDRATATRADKS